MLCPGRYLFTRRLARYKTIEPCFRSVCLCELLRKAACNCGILARSLVLDSGTGLGRLEQLPLTSDVIGSKASNDTICDLLEIVGC